MATFRWAATFSIVLALAGRLNAEGKSDAIIGLWFTDKQDAKVEIWKDDATGKYRGKLIWLKEPVYEEGDREAGKTKHDRENPDPALRDRPVLGLEILKDFNYNAEKDRWSDGRIYDPESGKLYRCNIWLDGPEKLNVKGYVGISVLGRTTLWTRAPAEEKPSS